MTSKTVKYHFGKSVHAGNTGVISFQFFWATYNFQFKTFIFVTLQCALQLKKNYKVTSVTQIATIHFQ